MTKVMISNATRLHAHRHAYVLQKSGLLDRFVTSIWHRPGCFPYSLIDRLPMPEGLRARVRAFLSKRSHAGLRPELVKEVSGAEYMRLAADILTRGKFRNEQLIWQKKKYDARTAKIVEKRRPGVFVGFEISCAKSFAAAKRVGATTVLDLAGLEHNFAARQQPENAVLNDDVQSQLLAQKTAELSLADYILCVSQLSKKALIESGHDARKIKVLNLGLDHSIFNTSGREWDRKDKPFRVLYAGNLSRAKGVDDLLHAFKMAGIKNGELCLAGSRGDIPDTAFDLPNVKLLSFLGAKDLAHWMRYADLFVLPSRLDSWGMVVTEAMACGLPVIATNMCGSAELINESNGWVIESGDRAALTSALINAAENRPSLIEKGKNAHVSVRGMTWEAYEANISEFHHRILRQRAEISL